MPSKNTARVRAFIQASLYWLGWAAIMVGSAEVLVSRGLAYAGSHLAVPAWWGGLSLGIGATFKVLRWAIPVITAALTKEAQKPGVTKNEVILAIALAVMSAGAGVMPDGAVVTVGDAVVRPADLPSDAPDVPSLLDSVEATEAAPDSTWDAPVEQDAGALDTFPGGEMGPEALAPMDEPWALGLLTRPVAIGVEMRPAA